MMRSNKLTVALAAATLLASGVTLAQPNRDLNYCDMTTEERQALRDSRRENFESLSEEERAAMLEQRRAAREARRAAAREQLESMSEEERQAARERFQGRGGPRQRCDQGATEQA